MKPRNQRFRERTILFIIRIARAVFYNTPFHRVPFVTVVYEWFFHLAISRDELVEVASHGAQLLVPGRDITILPSLMNGTYEVLELDLLERLLEPGMTFIDVGANVGIHTSIGAKCLAPGGSVFSFEPVPENFEILLQNISRNHLVNVVAESTAVGDSVGIVTIYLAEDSIGTHSLLPKNDSRSERSLAVPIITLDAYFKERMPDVVDVLKIDVEGFEPDVLRGAFKVLERTNQLLIEYDRSSIVANGGIDAFIELLAGFKYLYKINERAHVISEFSRRDFYEINYVNIFASKERVARALSPRSAIAN